MNQCGFSSLDVFVLANEETTLLRRTIEDVFSSSSNDDFSKVTVVAKSDNCPAYFEAKRMIERGLFGKLEVYVQKADNLINCIYEVTKLVSASHFVIMAADMEMDPSNIGEFISIAKERPQSIVCAAKWLDGSSVSGYGWFHRFGSKTMNTFISLLFGKKVKDPFSIYQIYPKQIFDRMNFSDPDRFLFEFTLKPLWCGVEYIEIPTTYNKRIEGRSNFNYLTLFYVAVRFCLTAFKLRLSPKESGVICGAIENR